MTRWWLIGAAAVFAALLITSIAFALLSQDTEFATGTPERAVQDLLRAAENDDITAAYAMLSQELRSKCELTDYVSEQRYNARDDRDIRATLRDSEPVDDTTLIYVRVTEFHSSGPFDSSEWTHERQYMLRQENSEWKFVEYPWPYDYCPGVEEE